MIRRDAVLTTLALMISTACFAEVASVAVDTRLSYGVGNLTGQAVQEITEAEPRLELQLSPRMLAVMSARLRLDFADELEPGPTETETYSSISQPLLIDDLGTLELRDAYVELALRAGVVRIGKQQIVWGRLDGIKVLDVLNPQSFREFILENFSDSRIGLWSAYLDISRGDWRAEMAAIPDNTGHAIPAAGAWFELRAPRYRYGANPTTPAPLIVTDRRGLTFDTTALAARLSRRFGSTEVSAIAYTGMDYEPLGRSRVLNTENVIERYYERRKLYGLSMESAIGGVVLRAELATQPGRVFNARTPDTLTSVALDQTTAGVGVDIDGPLNTFINIQHLVDYVAHAPESLVRPKRDQITTVFVKRTFAYDSLELSARWYYSKELGDRMISVAFAYAFSDKTRIRLAIDGFAGNASGVFGQFADRDRVTLALAHTF